MRVFHDSAISNHSLNHLLNDSQELLPAVLKKIVLLIKKASHLRHKKYSQFLGLPHQRINAFVGSQMHQCFCGFTHICIHACLCVCARACAHMHLCTCACVHASTCRCVFMFMCEHLLVLMWARIGICLRNVLMWCFAFAYIHLLLTFSRQASTCWQNYAQLEQSTLSTNHLRYLVVRPQKRGHLSGTQLSDYICVQLY